MTLNIGDKVKITGGPLFWLIRPQRRVEKGDVLTINYIQCDETRFVNGQKKPIRRFTVGFEECCFDCFHHTFFEINLPFVKLTTEQINAPMTPAREVIKSIKAFCSHWQGDSAYNYRLPTSPGYVYIITNIERIGPGRLTV